MKKIIISVGIPGSGKSTFLEKIKDQFLIFGYICPDQIREELTGNVSDQSKNKEVWELAYSRLEKLLMDNNNITVLFDATQADKKQRIDCIQKCKNFGADYIEGIYFNVSLEIAKQRNSERERRVPEFVLERMLKLLEENPPKIEDGFNSLILINP